MKQSILSKDELFSKVPVWSALRQMIVPTVIGQLIILVYNMADTFFLGRTGDPYKVGAATLILPVFNISISLANLSGVGGSSLISRLLGTGDRKEAKKVSVFSTYFAVALTLLFSLFFFIFKEDLLYLIGANESTFSFASDYLMCVMIIGGVPTVLSNVLASLLRCNGYSQEASVGITAGGLLNIALDPLFMFVLLPEGKEVLGAGLATLISNTASMLYFIIVCIKKRNESVVSLNVRCGMPSKKSIGEIFSVGFPSAVSTFLFDLDYMIIDKLMVVHGDIQLAAMGIVLKVERFPTSIGLGVSQGMMPLIAYNYSSGDHKRMDSFTVRAIGLALGIAAASVVGYEIFAENISAFFIDDAVTAEYASKFLRIRVLATPFMISSFLTMNIMQSYGKGFASFVVGVGRWALINIPMLYLLDDLLGENGIAWSQAISDFIAVLFSVLILFYLRKTLGLKKPKRE